MEGTLTELTEVLARPPVCPDCSCECEQDAAKFDLPMSGYKKGDTYWFCPACRMADAWEPGI
jgi:hypothetical protein